MRVPSRVYVGAVVFALITVFVTIPYTLIVVGGVYEPPEELGVASGSAGMKVFLVLASLYSVVLVVASWRALVAGARRDAARRRRHQELRQDVAQYAKQRREERPRPERPGQRPPPGFT